MNDANDTELLVEFDFYKLISADSKHYHCDFHKVSRQQKVILYRIVIDASMCSGMIVDIGKGSNQELVILSDDVTIGGELKQRIFSIIEDKL